MSTLSRLSSSRFSVSPMLAISSPKRSFLKGCAEPLAVNSQSTGSQGRVTLLIIDRVCLPALQGSFPRGLAVYQTGWPRWKAVHGDGHYVW